MAGRKYSIEFKIQATKRVAEDWRTQRDDIQIYVSSQERIQNSKDGADNGSNSSRLLYVAETIKQQRRKA